MRTTLRKSSQEILKRWGINIVHRPDFWDGKNRCVTVVIDESLDDDTILFEDGITYRMSSDAVDRCIDEILYNISDKFIIAIVQAINAYAKWYQVLIRKELGSVWLRKALERVAFLLDMYKVNIKHATMLDWKKCCAHFGSERNFKQLICDAIAYQADELFSMCLICKHCACGRDGKRYCKEVWVPVDEDGTAVKTLRRMNGDQPISNLLEDIIPTFTSRESCDVFERNDTKFIDALTRFRDTWQRRNQDGSIVRPADKEQGGIPRNHIDAQTTRTE